MMRRIDVTWNCPRRESEWTFRSNERGEYLFVGTGSNNQISWESGFQSLRRMKTAIRNYLRSVWEQDGYYDRPMPRIKYRPHQITDWEK